MLVQEAMQNFVHEMFHDSTAGHRILALWQVRRLSYVDLLRTQMRSQEYEDQQTPEALFVKGLQRRSARFATYPRADLDRLEMSLQGL